MTRLRTRHVKCDESQPRCQRCTSTGRICDEYGKASTLLSPPSGVAIAGSIASSPRSISPAEDVQELRSFDFFRNQVVPEIGGFFGSSTWNLVLQACTSEPAVNQAVVALGALYERLSLSLQPSNVGDPRLIETDFPLQQYAKALSGLRRYLSTTKDLNLDTVLACALIHISIEVIRNNYVNAVVHLESSLQLLQHSSTEAPSTAPGQSNRKALLKTAKVDSDLARAFLRLDLQASTYQGMRAPAVAGKHAEHVMTARFYSISQAKDVLDSLTGQLYSLIRTTIEDYRYRKDRDIPVDAVAQVAHIKDSLDIWNERFEKYLDRPTSRFSRQEQLAMLMQATQG
jgi:Fungal specific transcription factor domain/Fungal Zn(2)-Cys(6) binuclear cluster domain